MRVFIHYGTIWNLRNNLWMAKSQRQQICLISIIASVTNKQKGELSKNFRLISFHTTTITIRFNLLPVCSSVPPFYFLCYFTFFSFFWALLLMFHSVCGSVGGFYCLNFQKFSDTSLLKPGSLSLTKHSFQIREDLLDYKSAAIRRWHISWSQRRFVPRKLNLSERYWAVLRTSRLMNGKFSLLHISLVDLALLAWAENVFMQEIGRRLFSKWAKILKQSESLVSIACPVVRVYPSMG